NQERVKRGLPPANIILCRGAGALPEITPLASKYGIKAAAISAIPLVRGVARAAGLKLIEVPGATGSYDTDFMAKAKAAVKAIEEYDFLLLHVKATDIASHDRKIQEKIRIIEKIDKMVGYMLDNLNLDETYIAVTSDHTTALTTGKHEGDPVPVVIYGPEVRVDGVRRYNETDCARGGLCRIRAMELMPIIMNLLGKVEKFGS
ncbi:phosphoglycerate mutase, partial [Candidatus Bathyarchaeota archaeon]